VSNVTWFPTLADAGALIDDNLPRMIALNERPHIENSDAWLALRNEMDELFTENAWEGDESRVAFDILVEFAARKSEDVGSTDAA